MESVIYEGQVTHSRKKPAAHSFSYNIFMLYINLEELPYLFDRFLLWGTNKYSLARFRRSDHFGDIKLSLSHTVKKLIKKETGNIFDGSIFLLTNLSYFGYCFNPVSFYYCFSKDGYLEYIIAEVTNTPWGERCCYVLSDTERKQPTNIKKYYPLKKMHVSPFMPMNVDYEWAFTIPSKTLRVNMGNSQNGKNFFKVNMNLNRKIISSYSLARVLCLYPLITFKVIFAIHWQALKLWLKKCQFYVHPTKKISD